MRIELQRKRIDLRPRQDGEFTVRAGLACLEQAIRSKHDPNFNLVDDFGVSKVGTTFESSVRHWIGEHGGQRWSVAQWMQDQEAAFIELQLILREVGSCINCSVQVFGTPKEEGTRLLRRTPYALLRELNTCFTLVDQFGEVATEPTYISPRDINTFIDSQLYNPDAVPVVLFTETPDGRTYWQGNYGLDLINLARPYWIDRKGSQVLSGLLEDDRFSVYNGSARFYHPSDEAEFYHLTHPYAWESRDKSFYDSFQGIVAYETSRTLREGTVEPIWMPGALSTRIRMKTDASLLSRGSNEGWQEGELENWVKELAAEQVDAEVREAVSAANAEVERLRRDLQQANKREARLRYELRLARGEDAGTASEELQSERDFKDFADALIAFRDEEAWRDEVYVTEQAIEDALETNYGNPELAYKALVATLKAWRSKRNGESLGSSLFDFVKRESGVDLTQAISENESVENRKQYLVSLQDDDVECTHHLERGNDWDGRNCLRIYVALDSDRLVIGRARHLKTLGKGGS